MPDIVKNEYRIIFPALVVDVQDPLDLGRVRAEPEDKSILAVIQAYGIDGKYKWNTDPRVGPIDPLVVRPLVPLFLSLPMIEGERINILYQNSLYPWQDAYYVPGQYSSPMAIPFENFQAMKQQTGEGPQILPTLELKNSEGEYNNPQSQGIFPQPEDYGIIGRGSADLIIKAEEVLLRAGKTQKLSVHDYPIGYTRRSFLQLSNFKETSTIQPPRKTFRLEDDELFVRYLVEWDIENLDNLLGRFTGSVNLYKLPLSRSATTETIVSDSDLSSISQIYFTQQFTNKNFNDAVEIINQFISDVAFNILTIPQTGESGPDLSENRFPFIFKPNPTTLNSIDGNLSQSNFDRFYNNILFLDADYDNPSNQDNGFGIVLNQNETGKPTKTVFSEVQETTTTTDPVTYGVLGADNVLILSHLAKELDIENTIYGLTQEEILNNVLPRTSSVVRGEELLSLINLIVKFLISHVHPYHGLSAVPVGTDGTNIQQILFELNNANQTILNQNIRIN
jgi:hypothetical protein